jgi:hypothetical protein
MRVRTIAAALAGAAGLAGGLAGLARAAALAPAGSVTFLSGEARRISGTQQERLSVGSKVHPGDTVETGKRTRLELKLGDGSALRLGPVSRLELAAASFGRSPEEREVSAKLAVGNVWANVARSVGGSSRFEVATENAVAGVRGTTFRVDAAKDRSCVVRVYAGTVAVAAGPLPRPGHSEGTRQQVAGPQEVTREQWEKLVTTMMQVKVSASGTPGEPERFTLAVDDAWETWNRQRDGAAER